MANEKRKMKNEKFSIQRINTLISQIGYFVMHLLEGCS